MRKKVLLLLGLCSFFMVSCNKDDIMVEFDNAVKNDEVVIEEYIKTVPSNQYTKTSTGLRYVKLISNPNGKSVNTGDEVTMHLVLSQLKSGTFIDSTTIDKPMIFPFLGLRVFSGLEEAIALLKEGEKAELLIPSTIGFKNSTTYAPAWTALKATISITKYRTEAEQINQYIASKAFKVTETTSSGLRFIQDVSYPDSTAITTGKTVHVKYAGYSLNDVSFDAGEFDLVTGSNAVIKGFEEGILKMRKGEKAKLIFPSSIGYSSTGASSNGTYKIYPYSPLRFDIEITSVK